MSEFVRPFGPTIYQGKLTDEEIKYLKSVADVTFEARQNVGSDLAGNIKEQLGIVADQKEFMDVVQPHIRKYMNCLLYTSPSPRDATLSRMPSSA